MLLLSHRKQSSSSIQACKCSEFQTRMTEGAGAGWVYSVQQCQRGSSFSYSGSQEADLMQHNDTSNGHASAMQGAACLLWNSRLPDVTITRPLLPLTGKAALARAGSKSSSGLCGVSEIHLPLIFSSSCSSSAFKKLSGSTRSCSRACLLLASRSPPLPRPTGMQVKVM